MATHPLRSGASARPRRIALWIPAATALLWIAGFGHAEPAGRHRQSRAEATPPAQAATWKGTLLRIFRNISNHRLVAIAAGITFYALLAIFPGMAAIVSLYGFFGDPKNLAGLLAGLSGILPEGAITVIHDQMARIAAQPRQALGLTFIAGLLVSLWSANAGTKAMFDALNVVYGEHETRGLIKLNATSLLFTAAAIIFVLIAVGLVVVLPLVLQLVGLTAATHLVFQIGKWPSLLIVIGIGLAAIYRFGPDRAHARWRWITLGSALAGAAWLIVSIGFSIYAANFGKFNETYGSLGAVIGFMMWIWLSSMAILGGAEIDAEMERQHSAERRAG